jgi:hypothetical protein
MLDYEIIQIDGEKYTLKFSIKKALEMEKLTEKAFYTNANELIVGNISAYVSFLEFMVDGINGTDFLQKLIDSGKTLLDIRKIIESVLISSGFFAKPQTKTAVINQQNQQN